MSDIKNHDYQELKECNCFALKSSARLITKYYENFLREVGLKPTQFTILSVLINTGELTVSQLAEVVDNDRTGLSRNLKVIEGHGWIKSFLDEHDRRVKKIKITRAGTNILQAAIPLWKQAQKTIEDKMGRQSTIDLRHELKRMNQAAQ